MRRFGYGWLILLLVLAACEGQSNSEIPCEPFLILQSEMGETFTVDEFKSWIAGQYTLHKLTEIEVKNYTHLNADFSWQAGGYQYLAALENGEFNWLRIEKGKGRNMQVHDMFACFGTPETYHALHGLAIDDNDYQELDLFFPTVGILAHGYRHYSSNSHTTMLIKDDFPILYLRVTSPGTIDEMLKQIYGETNPYEYGVLRPWPNDWANIMIDVTPEIERLQNVP